MASCSTFIDRNISIWSTGFPPWICINKMQNWRWESQFANLLHSGYWISLTSLREISRLKMNQTGRMSLAPLHPPPSLRAINIINYQPASVFIFTMPILLARRASKLKSIFLQFACGGFQTDIASSLDLLPAAKNSHKILVNINKTKKNFKRF